MNRTQYIVLMGLLLATLWRVQDAWRWTDQRAQVGRLDESISLRAAECAMFQATVDQRSALNDERDRLKGALLDLFYPEHERHAGCFFPNYVIQISLLVERMQRFEDPSLELNALIPVRSDFKPKALAEIPIRTVDMELVGHYTSIVDLLRRMQTMESDRLVALTRVSLSPCTTHWDGLWSARLRVTTWLWCPPAGI